MVKIRNRNSIIRNKILKILQKPTGVSELKNKLTEISSFGTIAYHLKELEKEGLIKKENKKKLRGQPTTYFLTSLKIQKSPDDFLKKYDERRKLVKAEILKTIKENPNINDKELKKILIKKINFDWEGVDGDDYVDICFDYNENYVIRCYTLGIEGEKFLKENEKTTP